MRGAPPLVVATDLLALSVALPVYDKECPFEMRLQETDEAPQEVGTLEAVRCKICVQGDTTAPTTVVRGGRWLDSMSSG